MRTDLSQPTPRICLTAAESDVFKAIALGLGGLGFNNLKKESKEATKLLTEIQKRLIRIQDQQVDGMEMLKKITKWSDPDRIVPLKFR